MTTPTDKKTSTKKAKAPATTAKTDEVTDPTKAPINTDSDNLPPTLCAACGVVVHLIDGVFDDHPPPEGQGDPTCIGSGRVPAFVASTMRAAASIVEGEPASEDDNHAAVGLALAALGRDGHTQECAHSMVWDGVLCECGVEEPAADSEAFPRRRLMVSVKIAADDPGGVARSLLELINWIDQLERRAGGAGKDLKQREHASGDRTRNYSVELDDQVEISHADYEKARADWEKARE